MKKLNIAIILWKWLEWCWITTWAIEQMEWFNKLWHNCKLFYAKEKKYWRSKIRNNWYSEFSIKNSSIIDEFNKYDIVIFHSFPSVDFWLKINEDFFNIIKSIKWFKIWYMHELFLPNVKKIPYYYFWQMDLIYSFSLDNYFSNWLESIYEDLKKWERLKRYEMSIDVDELKKFAKPFENKKNQILYMWRFSTIKDPMRLEKYFEKYKWIWYKMIWLERSILTKTMIIDNKNCLYNSWQFKINNEIKNDVIDCYWEYERNEWLKEMWNSLFWATYYNTKKKESWDRMEYTQIEMIWTWTLPIFDKEWWENNVNLEWKRFCDLKKFCIFCDKNNINKTIEDIKCLQNDKNKYNEYIKNWLDIITKEYHYKNVLNRLIDNYYVLWKRKKNYDFFSNHLLDKYNIDKSLLKKHYFILYDLQKKDMLKEIWFFDYETKKINYLKLNLNNKLF